MVHPLLQITFVCLIYPVLVLCYAGQAAFISKNFHDDDYNHLSVSVPCKLQAYILLHCVLHLQIYVYLTRENMEIPVSVRHWFTALSLLASAVGSQATITASFSIINQCLALGCFPRVKVIHTSDKIHGQVYIPDINWILMVLCLTVTIGFHNIEKIGNATGTCISTLHLLV